MARRGQRDVGGAEQGAGARVLARERRRRARARRSAPGVRSSSSELGRRQAHQRRQLGAHTAFLGLLGLAREQQPVVQVDREQRLDEERLVGPGAVLHDARRSRSATLARTGTT